MTVAIVGLGAIGSHVAMAGRNWKKTLHVIDFDRVEAKNILSQFHSKMGRGKNKAVAMKMAMNGLFNVYVDQSPVRLNRDNIDHLLRSAELVLDCTDNIAARELMQEHCNHQQRRIPLLHGALAPGGQFGRVVWTEHFVADEEDGDGATCEDGENLAFHIQLASLMAQVAKTFLDTGKKASYQLTPFSVVRLV